MPGNWVLGKAICETGPVLFLKAFEDSFYEEYSLREPQII
jgi:hypothetical protein